MLRLLSNPVLMLAMTLVLAAATRAHAQAMPAALAGNWKIVKILPTSNPQCWDAARAQSLVGTTLRYAPGKLTSHGISYPFAEAFTRTLSPQKFHSEYRVDLPTLGIRAATIQEIDLQHDDADITGATTEIPGDTVLLAGPGRIVISACGVFYSAVKATH